MKTNTHSKDLETKKKGKRKRGIIEVNKIAAEIIK